MSEILCINTPSVPLTDSWITFACSCGENIHFNLLMNDFKLPFICPKCKQEYNQKDIEPFLREGRNGTVIFSPDMFKEVENNE